jgi:hypothetical protein
VVELRTRVWGSAMKISTPPLLKMRSVVSEDGRCLVNIGIGQYRRAAGDVDRILSPNMMQFATHLLVITFLGLSASVAHPRSLQISGTAGYLAEWEFRGELKETESGKEVSGPLAWKHIGLCSVNGPQEQPGEISARISGWGPLAKIDATISFNGARCAYSGRSGGTSGFMDCSDGSAVPLNMSIK